jgi:predicted MFS family arabinose efflux permease
MSTAREYKRTKYQWQFICLIIGSMIASIIGAIVFDDPGVRLLLTVAGALLLPLLLIIRVDQPGADR